MGRDYADEADRLQRSYDQAVGECLALGVRVYHPGGGALSLGELWEAIGEARQEGQGEGYALLMAVGTMKGSP